MVDISKVGGRYLTQEIVQQMSNKRVKIITEGVLKEGQFGSTLSIDVTLPDMSEKSWTLNGETVNNLKTAWGNDSKSWVNKIVDLKIEYVNNKNKIIGTPNVAVESIQ